MTSTINSLLGEISGARIDCGLRSSMCGGELLARARSLAHRLIGTCRDGRPVAVALDQGLENCVADLALLLSGLPAVPLPSFFTPQQRDHATQAAGASVILTASPNDPDGISVHPIATRDAFIPEETAKISFTSGSTGTPKGICLSVGHLLAVAQSVVDRIGKGNAGRHLALLPPGILLENVAGFYATLLAGGTYVALPQAEVGLAHPFLPDFAKMVEVIAGEHVSSVILVPEYLAGIVTVLEAADVRLPHLTIVAVGGAHVPPAMIDRALAAGLPVRQGYGLTECGSVVTLEDSGESARGSVGRPFDHNSITIAPDGEVIVHGPTFLGTVGAPRAPTPCATGDIGRIDNQGRLWIEGRKSNRIITSHGRNVSPEWVESVLLGEDAIVQAMVTGEGQSSLSALIVSGNPDTDIEAAIAAANSRLPAYAHVQSWRRVAPFSPANGQLTANGRLQRDAIIRTHFHGEDEMPFFERLEKETLTARNCLAATPQLMAGLTGDISRETYIAYLTQAYHHVRHTVPLLKETLARVGDRPELVSALEEYIAEETGHEAWILGDISEAGGDAQLAAASAPNAATQAMIDHAYDVVRNGNPVGFFGMVYVLEGTSVALATQGASAVARKLDLPPQAFTYLSSHGSLDQEHMKGLATLLDGFDDPADQQAVIDMANRMFDLFGGLFASIPMGMLDAAA